MFPFPNTKREILFFLIAIVIMLALFIVASLLKSKDSDATEDRDPFGEASSDCEVELAFTNLSLEACEEINSLWEVEWNNRLAECKSNSDLRESFWNEKLESTRVEKAGEWCWNELKDCEYDLEGEKKMSIWRMKSAGYLQYRTDNAIAKCDRCIVKNKIKKPKHGKRPEDWKSDSDWIEKSKLFTVAEIEKLEGD